MDVCVCVWESGENSSGDVWLWLQKGVPSSIGAKTYQEAALAHHQVVCVQVRGFE